MKKGSGTLKLQITIDGKTYAVDVEVLEDEESPQTPSYLPYHAAGALMVVLEAMKMETNVTAPRAGTVKSVHVTPGDPVKVNQLLVEFE